MHTTSYPPQNMATLLDGIMAWPSEHTILVTGISSDSRETVPGDLFIAYAGPKADRLRFIEQAIQKGAVAILKETEESIPSFETKTIADRCVPVGAIPKLNTQVGFIAARFYQNPCQDLKLIGITGTNGKTSCSQFIARLSSKPCGIIGTLGTGFPDDITPGLLTTPGAIALQKTFADLKKRGATHIAMEVSSHSLIQHRVAAVPFEIAVFTNLTRDHLDYHGDMIRYGQAKRLLFLTPTLKHAVINTDDAFGRQLLSEFSPHLNCYAYTTENTQLDGLTIPTVFAENIHYHTGGFSADIRSPWGEGKLQSQLLGRFNLSNLLATLTTVCLLNEHPSSSSTLLQSILAKIATLSTVPGRMQCFGGGHNPLIVVDYAHTPDALEKALTALRLHTQKQLWCVFGCGGDRDRGKRALMARVAESYSDHIILTDDNPRFEDPKCIMDDILQGMTDQQAAIVLHDRKRAIAYAIQQAQEGDIVLIAGKGHETYQQIGDVKIPFSDIDEVSIHVMSD